MAQSRPAIDWPPRLTAGLPELARRTRGATIEIGRSGDGREVLRVSGCEALGRGLVLEVVETGADEPPARQTELRFVSFSPLVVGPDAARDWRPPARLTGAELELGVQWTLYEPRTEPNRGLVVHLGGNRYVRRALLKDGWAVLSSSGTGRYFARRHRPQRFVLDSAADAPRVAAQIAATIDDELADWAYSLAAVLEYLERQRPELRQQPAAVMGFSIGALGLPAVVAYVPDRFAAAVLVAGGADLLRISQSSAKADPGLVIVTPQDADRAGLLRQLDEHYRRLTRLDPYQTAPLMQHMPRLVVQARLDRVVPVWSGQLLYERLGRPERWDYLAGHRHLLRVVMRFAAARLTGWVEQRVTSGDR